MKYFLTGVISVLLLIIIIHPVKRVNYVTPDQNPEAGQLEMGQEVVASSDNDENTGDGGSQGRIRGGPGFFSIYCRSCYGAIERRQQE